MTALQFLIPLAAGFEMTARLHDVVTCSRASPRPPRYQQRTPREQSATAPNIPPAAIWIHRYFTAYAAWMQRQSSPLQKTKVSEKIFQPLSQQALFNGRCPALGRLPGWRFELL